METTAAPPAPTATKASLWEDFIDIFFAPGEVFARRTDGRFIPALVVLTILSALLTYVFYSALSGAFQAEFAQTMERSGANAANVNLDRMQSMGRIFAVFGSVVMVPVVAFLTGLLTWLVTKLFRTRLTVVLAVTIVTYASFPRIFSMLSGILQGVLLNPQSLGAISAGPARFMDPATTSPILIALLGRLDLFVIWTVILMAIGLQVVGGMRKTDSYLASAVVWLIGTLAVVLPSFFMSLAG